MKELRVHVLLCKVTKDTMMCLWLSFYKSSVTASWPDQEIPCKDISKSCTFICFQIAFCLSLLISYCITSSHVLVFSFRKNWLRFVQIGIHDRYYLIVAAELRLIIFFTKSSKSPNMGPPIIDIWPLFKTFLIFIIVGIFILVYLACL